MPAWDGSALLCLSLLAVASGALLLGKTWLRRDCSAGILGSSSLPGCAAEAMALLGRATSAEKEKAEGEATGRGGR